MADLLLELGRNPQARRLVQGLGLPLPMPQALDRAKGPWDERPLFDLDVVVGPAATALTETIAATLGPSGANPHLVSGDETLARAFVAPGEAYGRPAQRIDPGALDERARFHALLFDASGVETPEGLRALYDYFHPLMRHLRANGRVLLLGRPPGAATGPAAAAAQSALEGFMRSVAKEIGRKGATANLVWVDRGADARLPGVLRFVFSAHAAFLTGQSLRVSARVKTEAAPEHVRSLEGKVALVTGAARGIGAETAGILAGEGAHVVCLDRPADDALTSQVARKIGGSVLLADVTDVEAPRTIADALLARHGGVDIVLHNAGVTRDRTLRNMKPEYWDQALDINLGAVVRITDVLLRRAVLRDDGRVICLSSIAGLAGNLGQTNYAASKAGLIGYVAAQAEALAPRGIAVNAVAPGFIETRLTAAIPVMIREVARRLSALGQGGRPDDVGRLVAFLAGPAAAGLTGQVIRICGGSFVGR